MSRVLFCCTKKRSLKNRFKYTKTYRFSQSHFTSSSFSFYLFLLLVKRYFPSPKEYFHNVQNPSPVYFSKMHTKMIFAYTTIPLLKSSLYSLYPLSFFVVANEIYQTILILLLKTLLFNIDLHRNCGVLQ